MLKSALFVAVGAAVMVTSRSTTAQVAMRPGAQVPALRVPTHQLLTPPPATPTAPAGISVQMQASAAMAPGVGGTNSNPFSLGMATTFDVQTTRASGTPQGLGIGSIHFVTGNDLPLWLNQCSHIGGCHAKVMITNVSAQGTVTYTLYPVVVTASDTGPAISLTFQYSQIQWSFTPVTGQPLYGNYTFGVE